MKIAIFNGLQMHYEMFGYILYYCKINNFSVTIYTTDDSKDWKLFYNNIFPNIKWMSDISFSEYYDNYDYIFLTTDDDYTFSNIINKKKNVICIDHYFQIRRSEIDIFFHIGTRPFSINYRKWALPCYPIVNSVSEKIEILTNINNGVHIVLLGGDNYIETIINRITSISTITLHIIARVFDMTLLCKLDKKFNICIYENISTIEMINIIKKTKYILCDATTHNGHINGLSMSGSIPLSFSNLSKLIISNKNNEYYKFSSVITFDINSNDNIDVCNTINPNEIEQIYQERHILINDFHNCLKDICI